MNEHIHYLPWVQIGGAQIEYEASPCGISSEELLASDKWSDDLDGITCPTCHKTFEAEIKHLDRQQQHEIAIEEGMLQGIEAYNEVMGWD